jgi:hypothetical protein
LEHAVVYLVVYSQANVLSIVAVHGLDTQSPKTWEAYADGSESDGPLVNWLKDDFMLPNLVPNARINTYDWNANTFSGAAVDDLFGHGITLLRELESSLLQV